ncbi:MAG TPA: hypothetical protein VJ644_00130 [Jiangellaceae bacterium]|nr:hypothetical protein [Jiangellaceae bacterium]
MCPACQCLRFPPADATEQTLIDLAGRHGLDARFLDDWERLPRKQSEIGSPEAGDRSP